MEYLIPIWWPSVSKIVQKHHGQSFNTAAVIADSDCLFVRGSNSN